MRKNFYYVLITAFLFGTMEVALKIAGVSFNSIQLTFIRFMIGGIFLLPFAIKDLKKRQYKITIGDFLYLLVLGVICICFSMTLFQIGVMRTNANLAAIIISINPIFTMLFAHFLVHDKFTKSKAVVLLLSITGLIISINPFKIVHGNDARGVLITFIAAISFGLYTAYGKKRIIKIGGLAQNSFSFILGSLVLFIILLFKGLPIIDGIGLDNILLLLYLGIVVTGIGYYCYLKAIETLGPSTASIAFFIKPIFAPFIALAILKEPITLNLIFGVGFVIAGSIVNMRGNNVRNKIQLELGERI